MSLSAEFSVAFSFLFSLLTLIGVVGNTLVIVAISADSKMRKCVMNILLLNLAVADLSNVVVAVAEWSPAVFLGAPKWILPDLLCPVARYFECVFLFTSISTQLIVCLERFIATTQPMRARSLCSRSSAIKAVTVAWLASGLFALPYAATHAVRAGHCTNLYGARNWWMRYKLAEFLLYFLLPCTVIMMVYSRVAAVLWDNSNPTLKSESSHIVQETSLRRLATRRNVVKMLVACATVYFVCYAPIQALFISRVVFDVRISPPYATILLLNALAVTCSASNPLLYALFSTRFRRRLRTLLAPSCKRGGEKTKYDSLPGTVQHSLPFLSASAQNYSS